MFVGRALLTKSLLSHERVVAERFPPLIVTHVFGAMGDRKLAPLTTFSAVTVGAAWSLPSKPCVPASGPGIPAVKYMALISPPLPPLPACSAQRLGTTMGVP